MTTMRARSIMIIGLVALGHSTALAAGESQATGSSDDLFAMQTQNTTQAPATQIQTSRIPANDEQAAKSSQASAPSNQTSQSVRPAASRARADNPLWTIPLDELTATRERPLFSPTRRPPPPIVVAATPVAPPPPPPKPPEPAKPQLELVGTVTGSALTEGIGIFVDKSDKTTLRLKTGDNHKGWTLRAVRPRQAELALGADSVVLDFPTPDMKTVAAAPAGAVPQPVSVPAAEPRPGNGTKFAPTDLAASEGKIIPAAAPASNVITFLPQGGRPPAPQVNPFAKRLP